MRLRNASLALEEQSARLTRHEAVSALGRPVRGDDSNDRDFLLGAYKAYNSEEKNET